MNAQSPQPAPAPVEELVSRLQADSGDQATITLIPEGYSHAKSQQKFKIIALGKSLMLMSVLSATGVQILSFATKRSGAIVRATIDLKVDSATAHNLTPVS